MSLTLASVANFPFQSGKYGFVTLVLKHYTCLIQIESANSSGTLRLICKRLPSPDNLAQALGLTKLPEQIPDSRLKSLLRYRFHLILGPCVYLYISLQ